MKNIRIPATLNRTRGNANALVEDEETLEDLEVELVRNVPA